MKKSILLYVVIVLLPFICFSQTLEGIDYISPFNEGLAAIKKGDKWAFINTEGTVVINFRDDLVKSNFDEGSYPVFKNSRCLIWEEKEGIKYYGYINTLGKSIIKPQFLNAANFNNEIAMAIKLAKDTIGHNDILDKPIVNYNYFEVIIDTKGEITHYLTQKPKHITLSKRFIKQSPKFTTKLLSDNLFAIWTKEKKWEIKKVDGLQ
tara:strand:+ start:3394 stop:4014 length:621 start_codon:yes stop_codon:yes gene_type:complete